jgi:cutinase
MRFRRALGIAVAGVAGLLIGSVAAVPSAGAQTCPDVEVVFARGTNEVGLGGVGQPFVDALRAKLPGKTVGQYAVNYAANDDYARATDGANDASAHIASMAANCPNTRIVLGGYSQGAAIVDFLTAPVSILGVSAPMLPPEAAKNIAAVTVFGNPSVKYAGGPLTALSPEFGPRTIDLCVPLDPLCFGTGFPLFHGLYLQSGLIDQAATFAAGRVS